MGIEDICENPGVTGSRGNSIHPNLVLTLVSFSVFLASSTWFSGTSAALALRRLWILNEVQCSWLTISVQLGFIAGTFLYAILNLADLFNARRVFFISALMGAVFNAVFAGLSQDLAFALVFRLNQRVLGPVFGELLAASPIRFLFGAPELLDPGTAVSTAGILVAVSLILCFALLLGFLASFAGISGLLLGYGLDLTRRFKAGGEE